MNYYIRFALTSFLALMTFAMPAADKKGLDNQRAEGYRGIWFTMGQRRSEYGDKYSGGLGTYTMKHIPIAIYSKEVNRTFFVYGGTPDKNQKYLLCMAGCFDHTTGLLQRPTVVYDKGVFGVKDPHDDPTIQIDKDGYIWVFVAGRANKRPGIRFRSVKPYDITKFEYVNESVMAYPQVIYDKEKGFFLFCTRYDGVRRTFYQKSADGIEWTDYAPIASIIEPGEGKSSGHYQFSNYDGKKLVCCFNRHIKGNPDTRTNIYYIQSEDWGNTWTNAKGEKVELPLTREENNALVYNFRREGRNCYIKDINFDKKGNPVILYLTSDNHLTGPAGGIRKWETAQWTGKEWRFRFLTTSSHCYDSGSLWVDAKGRWTVIAPTDKGPQEWGTGGEMVMWTSRNDGRKWNKAKVLTHDSVRNHGYARRPVNAAPEFYAFWADGNPNEFSISYLYFCDSDGNVFRMPYDMSEEWQKPESVR